MDGQNSILRSLLDLCQPSYTSVCLHNSASFRRKEKCPSKIHRHSLVPGRRYTSASGRKISGNVLTSVHGFEEVRLLEASDRPDASEHLYKKGKIQDGVTSHNSSDHSTGRLACVNRLERCLLPRAHSGRISEIPSVCSGQCSPTVHVSPIRAYNIAASVFKALTGCRGLNQNERHPSTPLSRRPAVTFTEQGTAIDTSGSSYSHFDRVRLAFEQGKESSRTHTVSSLPRCPVRYDPEYNFSTLRKNPSHPGKSSSCIGVPFSQSFTMSQNYRHHGVHDSHGQMGTMANASFPEGFSPTMGSEAPGPINPDNSVNEGQPPLVASAEKSPQLSLNSPCLLDHSHIRRQQQRLGCPLPERSSPREVGFPISKGSIQYPGTPCSLLCPSSLHPSGKGVVSPSEDGQYDSRVLHKETRRHSQSVPSEGGGADYVMGSDTSDRSNSGLSPRNSEYSSRFPIEDDTRQQRVVSPQRGFHLDPVTRIHTGSGPICIPMQLKTGEILHEKSLSPSVRGGCSNRSVDVPQSLCFSPNSSHSPVPVETQMGGGRGGRNNSLLAQQTMVSTVIPVELPGSSSAPIQTRSLAPGVDPSPLSITSAPDGLVFERERLEALGCPSQAISTLLNARKVSTNKVYQRIWSKFSDYTSTMNSSAKVPRVQDILGFLQTGLDLPLSVSSLRVQVSAISAFTGISWARHSLVRQFFKGAMRLRPLRKPRFSKWDLPLVLDFFSGDQDSTNQSIKDLSLKIVFLVAITSAKRVSEIGSLGSKEPFLTFFPDRVVLIPMLGSKPKVTSIFHENQEIVLPTFHSSEGSMVHPLDVGKILKQYLEATASFRKSDHLFVSFHGKNKGMRASSRTIAAWIVQAIQRAYKAKGLAPPEAVTAHSTRSVSTSWAAARHVSPEVICKAASWSSLNTFMTHYCVEPASLSSVNFGLNILSVDNVN